MITFGCHDNKVSPKPDNTQMSSNCLKLTYYDFILLFPVASKQVFTLLAHLEHLIHVICKIVYLLDGMISVATFMLQR